MNPKGIREFAQFKRKGITPISSQSLKNALTEELKNLKDKKSIPHLFLKYLKKFDENNFSIKEIIKLALNEKNVKHFETCKQKNITKEVITFVLNDIKKTRNEFSNPSLFFKFININNLKNLQSEDIENMIYLGLEKMNIYISCDKNLIGLLFNMIKLNDDKILKKTKKIIFDETINSFYLYFFEFQNKKLRGDNEMLKNFISHFKIFSFFLKNKFFLQLEKNTQENIIRITLASFFIGSAMEDNIFNNLKSFANNLNDLIKRKKNDFYFKNINEKKDRMYQEIEKELSSFSDYNNCIAQKSFEEKILKNLFIFNTKFFNLLLKKIPHLFYSPLIWHLVIGENYFSDSIKEYLEKSNFALCNFKEEILNYEITKKIFNNQFDEFIEKNKKCEILNIVEDLNKFYNQYIQKLIKNEESLLLLFHTTSHLFIKYYLLEIFQNLLKNFPINLIDFNKSDIHKFDNIYIQMTQSFQAFVFILFLEIFQNIEVENYLKELINFLIFFIEQDFFVKIQFGIFLKIIEFIFIKVYSLKDNNFNSFKQGVRLVRFFLPKYNSLYPNLSEKQKESFCLFCLKIYTILNEILENSITSKNQNFSEDLLIYILNIYRSLLLSPVFDPSNKYLNFRVIFLNMITILEQNKGKIKEKIFSTLMAFFNQYKNQIIHREIDFIYFKVILAYIINYSVKDATYCLSNLDGSDASSLIFIRDKKYLENEEFQNFCHLMIKKMRKKNRNILKSYLETNLTGEELKKKYVNDYKIILKDLTFHIKDNINKVEIYFCMNILKSNVVELDFKLKIFEKIFDCVTKDVQDFFESLFLHLKNNIYPEELFFNKKFILNFFLTLFKNIKSKSVSKTIMKIHFFLLKKCVLNGLITFEEDCILKDLIKDIELMKKVLDKQFTKEKKYSLKEPKILLEELKEFQLPRVKRLSDDVSMKNFQVKNLDLMIKEHTFENLDLNQFVYLKYFFRYLLIEVIEINENKTHGLFFLQVVDFYKFVTNHLKQMNNSEKNQNEFPKADLITKIEAQQNSSNYKNSEQIFTEKVAEQEGEKTLKKQSSSKKSKIDPNLEIEDKKILNFYMSKIGNNIILDSYLLKSFFISENLMEFIDKESIVKLNDYILDNNSQLNTKEKLEFNNNFIKNRNEIKNYLFEIKMLFLNFLIKKNMSDLIRRYLEKIEEFFEELKRFFIHSCECVFVEFDEKTSESKRKDLLEINLVSYIGLQDLRNFFNKNFLKKFDETVILMNIFQIFKLIVNFIQKDDEIVVSLRKVELLEELAKFQFSHGTFTFENIWKIQETGFVNSYL